MFYYSNNEKRKKDSQSKRRSSHRGTETDAVSYAGSQQSYSNTSTSSYATDSYQNSGSALSAKEAFFEKLHNENSTRPELVDVIFISLLNDNLTTVMLKISIVIDKGKIFNYR